MSYWPSVRFHLPVRIEFRSAQLSLSVLSTKSLRTLDAIHLASALAVDTDIEAVVTYDGRQVEAAESAGLVCLSPA
jgi:predicted nucleic acid-binding protein